MKATRWEFTNRAVVFGMILGLSFAAYSFDRENVTGLIANWLSARTGWDADRIARGLFAAAALLLAVAALFRTWASSYLNATVVYASQVKTEALVADGPYRRVRNPLYLANVLMAIAVGSMMSRTGIVLAVAMMIVFCYRLILREESELALTQGETYGAYLNAVPRILPSPVARAAAGGGRADWKSGFKAELWYWGFAVALAVFAATLEMKWFIWAMTVSLAFFGISSWVMEKGRGGK